jgi:hypothetical protein
MVLDTPPHETSRAPATLVPHETRFYGVTPPIAVLVLAVAALAVAILLLAQGSTAAGVIVLVAAVLLLVAFAALTRRRELRRARARAGSLVESLSVRSGARREVLRLRRELEELGAARQGALLALGTAVYEGDEAGMERTREVVRGLGEGIESREAEMQTIIETAEAQIAQAKLGEQPTSVIDPPTPSPSPDPAGPVTVPEPYPPPDEGDPPQPAPIPEPYPPPDEPTPPQPQ